MEDSLGWEQATVIPVRGTGRTFEIPIPDDWLSLCRAFPLEVTASRRDDWFRVTGRDGRWVIPDWERVAEQWDAVHLAVQGYFSSATRALHLDPDTASVIAGCARQHHLADGRRTRLGGPAAGMAARTGNDSWTPLQSD
ncbi:hypothetical protein E4J89_19060 [Arthrobacter sp. CAU 1506]|uniref:hypothetical protein n=1 Tax=Arthrobacter sp. CAU 1506 TaxID=2560052 RepID=UPI0010AC6FB1|nr:hypothetical protein [Arthrobacter sp. CAU 1506]TJY64045.1 hypothetical protein E4J89_19060 [Arthrobacter sp. CAU 1506]